MKAKITGIAIITALLVFGCGEGGPGSPGSWGQNKTNQMVSALITPSTTTVDAITTCADGSAKSPLLTADDADVTVTVTQLNPALPVGSLFVERYTLDFFTQTPGAPPMASYSSGFLSIDISGTPNIDVIMVDLNRKIQYTQDITSGKYQPRNQYQTYTAKYTFYGKDQYGSNFGFISQTTFSIGDYSPC